MRITNAMIKQFISELEYEAENGFSAGVVKSNLNKEAKLVAEGQCSAFKVIAERLKTRFQITEL